MNLHALFKYKPPASKMKVIFELHLNLSGLMKPHTVNTVCQKVYCKQAFHQNRSTPSCLMWNNIKYFLRNKHNFLYGSWVRTASNSPLVDSEDSTARIPAVPQTKCCIHRVKSRDSAISIWYRQSDTSVFLCKLLFHCFSIFLFIHLLLAMHCSLYNDRKAKWITKKGIHTETNSFITSCTSSIQLPSFTLHLLNPSKCGHLMTTVF